MPNLIDLPRLPAPDVIEELDYETIRQVMIDALVAEIPGFTVVESDPAIKVIEIAAYRETLLRQRINEAARSIMLAYAAGADLDQLGVFYGVERLVIVAADPDANPPVEQVLESDEAFLRRMRLSLRGLSVAGPADSYVYWALSASGDVLDASATSPKFTFVEWLSDTDIRMRVIDDAGLDQPLPGDVVVSVLSRLGVGTPDTALVETVQGSVADDAVRPMTDNPMTRAADIVEYRIDATLYFYEGPDQSLVYDAAIAAAQAYADANHRLGRDIARSGVYGALHQPGVQRVELTAPATDIAIAPREAAYCTQINVSIGGINE